MKDINDIFSKTIAKIAQTPNLRFDQPIFEAPMTSESVPDSPVQKPENVQEVAKVKNQVTSPKIEEPASRVPEDHIPRKFVDIISEQLGDQTSSLMEAYRRLNLIQADNPSLDLDSIKRLISEAISATKIIKDRSFGVRVI